MKTDCIETKVAPCADSSPSPCSAYLLEISGNSELLEIARKAIENKLIEWRDDRLSEHLRANGLVCREKDGSESSIIRFGPETAMRIGLKAIADHILQNDQGESQTPAE